MFIIPTWLYQSLSTGKRLKSKSVTYYLIELESYLIPLSLIGTDMNIMDNLFQERIGQPLTTLQDVELQLGLLYERIRSVIPDAAILVSGSAAFYKHFHKHIGGEFTINDLDIDLVHNEIEVQRVFDEIKSHPKVKMLRDTCAVIEMGYGDLHIDLKHRKILQRFRSGAKSSHRLIRFDNRGNVCMFYKRLNREKDQEKIAIINRFPRDN